MFVEIRAGEGGEDARLLVLDTFRIYGRAAVRGGL
jgi:protein subunit release factor A